MHYQCYILQEQGSWDFIIFPIDFVTVMQEGDYSPASVEETAANEPPTDPMGNDSSWMHYLHKKLLALKGIFIQPDCLKKTIHHQKIFW